MVIRMPSFFHVYSGPIPACRQPHPSYQTQSLLLHQQLLMSPELREACRPSRPPSGPQSRPRTGLRNQQNGEAGPRIGHKSISLAERERQGEDPGLVEIMALRMIYIMLQLATVIYQVLLLYKTCNSSVMASLMYSVGCSWPFFGSYLS